jgi:hypothetical protein
LAAWRLSVNASGDGGELLVRLEFGNFLACYFFLLSSAVDVNCLCMSVSVKVPHAFFGGTVNANNRLKIGW